MARKKEEVLAGLPLKSCVAAGLIGNDFDVDGGLDVAVYARLNQREGGILLHEHGHKDWDI